MLQCNHARAKQLAYNSGAEKGQAQLKNKPDAEPAELQGWHGAEMVIKPGFQALAKPSQVSPAMSACTAKFLCTLARAGSIQVFPLTRGTPKPIAYARAASKFQIHGQSPELNARVSGFGLSGNFPSTTGT